MPPSVPVRTCAHSMAAVDPQAEQAWLRTHARCAGLRLPLSALSDLVRILGGSTHIPFKVQNGLA